MPLDALEAIEAIEVLVVDCQASGATPAHGDLLALGWAFSSARELSPVRDHWVRPRTTRPVPRPVRELTGWSEASLAMARDEREVWSWLLDELHARSAAPVVPTVIHFARFELTFLRELHARLLPERDFPLDACCLHAIAQRLYPDLPRRNIRALAGFLGHTTDLTRHVAGHVQASAFIWRALIPRLAERGVSTWPELHAWLAQAPKPSRSRRRVYPLSVERRRELPDRPGVYRFVRSNDSVLYVGKAASLKKRIAGHFTRSGPATERGLELLTQVHDVRYTETPSVLEAALLESDEIKRIDPPYNVQLRSAERQAWFAARDYRHASPTPDAEHTIGPLPSEAALIGLGAWRALLAEPLDSGRVPSPPLCALVLAVPVAWLPPTELFREGWRACCEELFGVGGGPVPRAQRRVAGVARALWLQRGRAEADRSSEDTPPDHWDLARVRRRLERSLVNGGLVLRRARLLRLLADCSIGYRERGMPRARALVICGAEIVERLELAELSALFALPVRASRALAERRSCFDATRYDRLRVLATELRRVEQEGGELALRIGRHAFQHAQVLALLRGV